MNVYTAVEGLAAGRPILAQPVAMNGPGEQFGKPPVFERQVSSLAITSWH